MSTSEVNLASSLRDTNAANKPRVLSPVVTRAQGFHGLARCVNILDVKAKTTRKKKSPRRGTAGPSLAVRPAGGRPPIEPQRLRPFWESAGVGYFGYRFILTAKLFDHMLVRAAGGERQLTPPQVRVISQLGLLGQGTVRSLAEGAFVDRAEVSRALREMERLRLIRRVANKADARSSVFMLSAKGREAYLDTGSHAAQMLKAVIGGLSKRQIETLDRAFWEIANRCLTGGEPDTQVARGWL